MHTYTERENEEANKRGKLLTVNLGNGSTNIICIIFTFTT